MKKLAIIISLCAVIAACSNEKPGQDSSMASNETATNSADATASTAATSDPSSKGAQLLASSDCLGCHKEQDKLVGPAYKDVAAKYPDNEENVDKLAKKIIAGGSGVWGEVPMSAHPNLALNDAKEMVKYILTIK
ncbi:MAG: c-type cytochrome [Sphingobacteriaceae bacterium]|nr:MAG: c-type cytochrome [Sphingobacteriaceae bacterium]